MIATMPAALAVFDRILCGVDTTPESLEAVRQAERLRSVDGTLRLAAVMEVDTAVHAGFAMSRALQELEAAAEDGLRRAADEVEPTSSHLLAGEPAPCLLAEIQETSATLVAIGPRGHSRATGMLLGGVAARLLHEAPCSVLLARAPAFGEFPSSIIVGVDGSSQSLAAAAVAKAISERFGSEYLIVAATGGNRIDLPPIQALSPYFVTDPGRPAEVLAELSNEADLLVIGSRGLHVPRALGSVRTGRSPSLELRPRRPQRPGGTISATTDHAASTEAGNSMFERILVGIDDSPESLEAARQAVVLARGQITLLAAYDVTDAVVGGAMPPAPVYLDEGPIRENVEAALERARQELSPVEPVTKIGRGRPWQVLLDEIEAEHHTLVAVGSHGAGRAKGILIGSTATELIHKAPCSVLVARPPLKQFPSSIIAGLDGSKESAVADAVARDIAARFGADLERYENLPEPVDALVEAAMGADLLVVGSRGLHGLKALGSVSERVAHNARCSVLIVR